MKRITKLLIFVFPLLVIFFVSITLFWRTPQNEACPKTELICPDGTKLVRNLPNCDLPLCPEVENKINTEPSQRQQAIERYLLSEKYFSWKTRENSFNFCATENLDPDQELFPLFLWVYCGEYAWENNRLVRLSGISLPTQIDYPNELSFFDLSRFSYRSPRDGIRFEGDIKEIFPEKMLSKIQSFSSLKLEKELETRAFNNALTWEKIKDAVQSCQVKSIFQAHSLAVEVELKNGITLQAREPQIDEIFKLINSNEQQCGKIRMATE